MKKFASLFPIILALAGCTSQPLEEPAQPSQTAIAENEVYVTSPCTDFEVNEATVLKLAKNFNESTSVSRGATKTVKSIESVNDEGGNPLLYVINYENNGGFLVVSAKAESQPVLAFSDEGSFDLGTVGNSGVSLWLSDQKLLVKHVDSLPDSIIAQNRLMWMKYLGEKRPLEATAMSRGDLQEIWPMIQAQINAWEADGYTVYTFNEYQKSGGFDHLPELERQRVENIPYSEVNIYYGDPTRLTFVIVKERRPEDVAPLCKTLWGQTRGYNKYNPHYDAANDTLWPIGCTTVAAGQIMRYHEWPPEFEWSKMSNYSPTDATAKFLGVLADKIKVTYKINEASANIDKVKDALKAYGFSNVKIESYNRYLALEEIKDGYPVYMRGVNTVDGGGHAWVADGIRYTGGTDMCQIWGVENSPQGYTPQRLYKLYEFIGKNSFVMPAFHMNWGWRGGHNGYFWEDRVDIYLNGTLLYDFSKDRKMIVNIYP